MRCFNHTASARCGHNIPTPEVHIGRILRIGEMPIKVTVSEADPIIQLTHCALGRQSAELMMRMVRSP